MLPRFLARVVELAALLLFIAALCSPAHAQTVIVSGNLKNIIGGNITANAWVRLELQNCGGNWPVVAGSLLVQSRYDLKPDGSGNISQGVYPNQGAGAITCAGQPTTFYNATRYLNNSAVGAPVPLIVFGGSSLDLDTAPTCGTPVTASCQLISTPTGPIAVGSTGPAGALVCAAGTCGTNGDFNVAGFLTSKAFMNTRMATQYPGATIVEQIRAAHSSCSGGACHIFVAAGTYTASSCAIWPSGAAGQMGVELLSNVTLFGAGRGKTVINWTHGASDPASCALFGHGSAASDIRISNMTVNVTENAATSNVNSANVIYSNLCTNCTFDDLEIDSSADRALEFLDPIASRVTNSFFTLRNTSAVNSGNSAIGNNGNGGTTNPVGLSTENNQFVMLGSTAASVVVITRSGSQSINDTFDFTQGTLPKSGQDAIETGNTDGVNALVQNLQLIHPVMRGSGNGQGIRLSFLNGRVDHAEIDHGFLFVTVAGGNASVPNSGIVIDSPHVRFGEVSVQCQSGDVGYSNITVLNAVTEDGEQSYQNCNSPNSANGARFPAMVVKNSIVRNPRGGVNRAVGLQCIYCSVLDNATVINGCGESVTGCAGMFLLNDAAHPLVSFAHPVIIDNTIDYSTGTVCSVAQTITFPLPGACPGSAVASNMLLLTGGTWNSASNQRTIAIGGTVYHIAAVQDATHLILEETVTLASGTTYAMLRGMYKGLELQGAGLTSPSNAVFYAANGWISSAIAEDGAMPTMPAMVNNTITPYVCAGCTLEYRSKHTAIGSATLVSATPSAVTVTLTGSDVFVGSTSYKCSLTNETDSTHGLKITYVSGTQFTITGPNTVTDGVSYVCPGI